MSKRPFLFLSVLVLLGIEFSLGVWRYKNILEDEQLFTLTNAVFLEYEGSDFVEWEYPDSCSLNNKSSPKAVMKCTHSGYQRVKPLVSSAEEEEEARYLYIRDSYFSFVWYAVMPINRSSPDKFFQTVRMWIMDPGQADQAEINTTALVPSTQSQYVTKHFFNLGQYPEIKLNSSHMVLGHFKREGYWEAFIPGNKKYCNFHIHAQPVSFQHRFVISSQHTFYWSDPERPLTGREVALRLAPGSLLSLVWGTCESHHALLLSDTGSYLTQDAFRSYRELVVDPGSLPVPPEGYLTVESAALLEDGVLFLMDGALYWWDEQERVLGSHPGLPDRGVKGMFQRTCCVDYYPIKDRELSSLLVWDDHTLFMGSKRFRADRPDYLQAVLTLTNQITVLTAAFGSHPASLACLVMYVTDGNAARPFLITYNQLEPGWTTTTFMTKFQVEDLPSGPFSMRFVDSALDSLLLWNQRTVLYSFRKDNEWGALRPPNATDLGLASRGSRIHQVSLDHKWNLLVKMENNVLFYSKVGMHGVVPLHTWARPDQRAALYLNQRDVFVMVTVTTEGTLEVNRYPLSMETLSALRGAQHECPFISFQHSMGVLAYYLDKGDRLAFWALVVYPEGKGVHVRLLNNREHLLHILETSLIESVHKVDTVNTTINIWQQVDYSDGGSYKDLMKQTSGIMTLELLPSQIGNTCQLPRNRISHFHVGCPPNRHIRVSRPWGMPCEMHSLTNYTISRFVLRNPPQKDLVVDYDWEKFGCLLKLHYKTAFHPDLDLYDGEKFVRAVDANFITMERFGRRDYSFNATMRQVACLREAQTWRSMLSTGKSLEDAWGPENYQSCFKVTPGKLGNLDQPYEIMNRTSSNHLTFSQVDSAIYVFHVRILDPNYSFCDLHTVFAVQTFGITIPKYQHLTAYVALMFTFVSLCILAYSYCRYVTIFQKLHAARKLKYE